MDEKNPLPPPTYNETYGSNMNQTQPPPGQQYPPSQGYPAPIQYPPVQGYPQQGGQYPPPQGYPQPGAQYPPTIVAATSKPFGNVTVVDQTGPPPPCHVRYRVLIIIFVILFIFLIIMGISFATNF